MYETFRNASRYLLIYIKSYAGQRIGKVATRAINWPTGTNKPKPKSIRPYQKSDLKSKPGRKKLKS